MKGSLSSSQALGGFTTTVSDPESNIKLMLVNTARENFKGYTCHEVERVREVQRIQGMIANPTEKEFSGMVREQLLTICPVTVSDIDNANQIFGPDVASLRGKRTLTKPDCIQVKYVQRKMFGARIFGSSRLNE